MEPRDMEVEEEFFEDEDFEICGKPQNEEDELFDTIVGRLEDIVMSDEFNDLQTNFFEKYCNEFTSDEENKLIYMQIFQEYVSTIEGYIERQLSDVDMGAFGQMLMQKQESIDGALFEMLLSFTEFQTFKEIMLSHQNTSELEISGQASIIHTDEMEDGEERPDLQGLCIQRLEKQ